VRLTRLLGPVEWTAYRVLLVDVGEEQGWRESDFSQMAGITVASFTSMATGMAAAAALIRGLARRGTGLLGNFWLDVIRSVLYVVLPLAALASILLVASGVPQTLEHYLNAHGPTGLSQSTGSEAITELRRVAGTQLDARFVELFVVILERERIGFTHGEDADFEAELAIEQRIREPARPRVAA
jgi:hypothetical protein